ncbi:MAG: hypothetical protein ACXWLM_05500 [Myxococcales bacterium]
MAVRLQITRGMRRLFLSGQMTCAMLLGAGLLLRAQAALHSEPEVTQAAESPRTRPSEMTGERARLAPRVVRAEPPATPRTVHKNSHTRKGFAHPQPRPRVRKSGVALAGRWFRVG